MGGLRPDVWFLALSTSLVFHYLAYEYFVSRQARRKLEKMLRDKTDRLKVNKMLIFREKKVVCDHSNCSLECDLGKMEYVLDMVRSATKTVEICIYMMSYTPLGEALVRAFERGVEVRVVADDEFSKKSHSYLRILKAKGIEVRTRFSKFIMHHKFIVVDSKILITGSMNFTGTGVHCNIENVLLTTYPCLIVSFKTAFEELWKEFA